MTPEEALAAAIKIVGGKTLLAAYINEATPDRPCTPQALGQWRRCPAERVLQVAAAVRQARQSKAPDEHDLRPDIYPHPKRK